MSATFLVARIVIAAAFLGAPFMATASPTSQLATANDPLAEHRWRSRVVVIFGARPGDPLVAQQRRIIATMGAGARERNVVLIELLGSTRVTSAMRARLCVPEAGFHAVLVGKDGEPKLSSFEPISASELTRTIDAMPMRKQEMRR
jgi:Domain of unknown function (DUF4174)